MFKRHTIFQRTLVRAPMRLDVLPVFQCLFLPWLYFCGIYALLSCELHFYRATLTYTLVALAALLLAALGWMSLRSAKSFQEPSWFSFLFVTMAVAWLLGVVFGNLNFAATTQPYCQYANLDILPEVSPSWTGEEVMSSGRAFFGKTSVLDIRRSMAFKNIETYCVAPISSGAFGAVLPLENYDFWAVGLNCCSLNTADFRCGEYDNPNAHSGLRVLDDEQRSFFRLAVEQAEAAYSLKAKHPVFFYWVQDATAEMDSFRNDGYKYYLIGVLSHFAWQMLCVLLAVAAFSKG
ncbi:unnamed protein product [Effrenium voratum]|uniref:Uncharacterized protein n=1 Tax=Effrenium voratum TaxID=2562239 RepID=A0AA36IFT0_9DINO|nr:unnamed protein product [Effrenium voratum]CAJ1448077.1 unnamed protein product [Effrenium voratum]